MASVSEARPAHPAEARRAGEFVDRWIFPFTAALLFVTALAGFVPDSFERLAAIKAGERAPFSIWAHFHAVAMGLWLCLLLAQSILVATGNTRHHRKLGTASFVLIPVVIASMLLIVIARYAQVWDALAGASPAAQGKLSKALAAANNNLLSQLRAGGLFALFAFMSLRARKLDPGYHKRMMMLATIVVMGAAINRVPGLPTTMPGSPLSLDLWGLVLMSPLLIWDLRRNGRVHPAFLTGYGIWIAVSIGVHLLWGTPWWQAEVPRLMGYA